MLICTTQKEKTAEINSSKIRTYTVNFKHIYS